LHEVARVKWLGYSYCYMYEGLRNYRLLPPNGAQAKCSAIRCAQKTNNK